MEISVRKAKKNEINRINDMYDRVNFPHSNFDNEFIAIAEIDEQKIGLGRIIDIDGENAELGGMYVLEKYRGSGVAGKIIELLLQNSKQFNSIFCLPFEKLKDYYGRFGFEELNKENYFKVPEKILKKHKRCNETFEDKVLLLSLKV